MRYKWHFSCVLKFTLSSNCSRLHLGTFSGLSRFTPCPILFSSIFFSISLTFQSVFSIFPAIAIQLQWWHISCQKQVTHYHHTVPIARRRPYHHTVPIARRRSYHHTVPIACRRSYHHTVPIARRRPYHHTVPIAHRRSYHHTVPIACRRPYHHTVPIAHCRSYHHTVPIARRRSFGFFSTAVPFSFSSKVFIRPDKSLSTAPFRASTNIRASWS